MHGLHVMEQTKLMVRNLYTEALPVQAEPAGSLGPRLVVFVVAAVNKSLAF